jgi:DNA-directed RNA polymerase specialized sigma24 family protein
VFEEAYLQFAPRLRKVAIKKFGIQPEDAEGLVQDVFATFLMHAAGVEQVERYLIGAICNASRKHLQRADSAVLVCAEHPCMATPGDVLLRQIERKQLLARVFARIGSRCRDLLRRYYVRGEATSAIAVDLESTPGSVLVNLHKCRKRAISAYRSITGTT